MARAKELELLSGVTLMGTTKSSLRNWSLVLKVYEDNYENIDCGIVKRIIDFQLKRNIEVYFPFINSSPLQLHVTRFKQIIASLVK